MCVMNTKYTKFPLFDIGEIFRWKFELKIVANTPHMRRLLL
jgi:hypothetical protein